MRRTLGAILDLRHVDYTKLNGHPHLLGGEADAIRAYIVSSMSCASSADTSVDPLDPSSLGPQGGVAVLDDFQDH